MPGDQDMERRIRALIAGMLWQWCFAQTKPVMTGGHLASFASSATLYDVGFNHFFRANNDSFGGDLIYYQGHCAPGFMPAHFRRPLN